MEVSFVALADKHNEILSVTFKSTVTDHSSPFDDGAVSKTSLNRRQKKSQFSRENGSAVPLFSRFVDEQTARTIYNPVLIIELLPTAFTNHDDRTCSSG